MSKILNALKMAYVGFFEEMKWDYSVKFSDGRQFSRKGIKIDYKSMIYKFDEEYTPHDN